MVFQLINSYALVYFLEKEEKHQHMNDNYFNDFVFCCEKIGDLICNINDSFLGYKKDYNHL